VRRARDDTFAPPDMVFSELAHVSLLLAPWRRWSGRRGPPRHLQCRPARLSGLLQAGRAGNAALAELSAARRRQWRLPLNLLTWRSLTRKRLTGIGLSGQAAGKLTRRLRQPRLSGSGWTSRQARPSGLRRQGGFSRRARAGWQAGLFGLHWGAGLLRLTRTRQSSLLLSGLFRRRLLSLPIWHGRQGGLTGLTRQRPRSCLSGLTRSLQLARLLRRTWPLSQALPSRRTRLLSRTIL
jgi:hypothetical protein